MNLIITLCYYLTIITTASCLIRNVLVDNRISGQTRRSVRDTNAAALRSLPVATLDERTLWELKLLLREEGSPGEAVSAIARVRFIESKNYEPPQGYVFVEDDINGLIKVNDKGLTSNYKLSEDINDRKDGLWIWGLFEEPKHPYLYFTLNVYDTLFVGEEEKKIYGRGVPGEKLYIRFNHARDKNNNVLLSDGIITYQQIEMVQVGI